MHAATLSKTDVVQVYSRIAFFYDAWGHLTESRARNRALALANIQDGESVLEVAVGTGLAFRELVKANPHGTTHGIDLTEAMLDKARHKVRQSSARYELSVGDAYDLRYDAARFDVLVNNYMFDLLPANDFEKVLTEFKRVLKPNGRLILVNMTTGERLHQRLYEAIYQVNPRWIGGCRGVRLSDTLQQVGFRDISREMISQLGFPSEVLRAAV